jgi:predicted transcriptional regulator
MRRYKETTILAILNAIDNEINRISLIMKYLNLSGTSARNYLDYLIKIGVIERKGGEYKLTEKGRRVLELLREKRKIEVELAFIFKELKDHIL